MFRDNKIIRKMLSKCFKFGEWHLIPLSEKKYAQDIIRILNENYDIVSVVEIGCGLGDILSNLKGKKCVGIDTSKEVIYAAKILSPKIEYHIGSFSQLQHKKIDCLITVNFIHMIPSKDLKNIYRDFFRKHQFTTF